MSQKLPNLPPTYDRPPSPPTPPPRVNSVQNRLSLFVKKDWMMHSGHPACYKVECDALTDEDLDTLAFIVSLKGLFRSVIGVPTGGIRFATALEKYKSNSGVRLIVDDVLTTGQSMEQMKITLGWTDAVGVVIFSRGACPDWIRPIFQMHIFD